MKPSDQIDIAVPIEFICALLGLPEDIKGVYHSQKTNTLFIRASQKDIDNPCMSATIQKNEDGSLVATIHQTTVQTFGHNYVRNPGSEFRVSRYNIGLEEVAREPLKHKV